MQCLHPAFLFGVNSLHHGGGEIGEEGGGAVEPAQAGIAAVDMCPAVFPAKHRPFAEYGQTLQRRGAVAARHRIGQDPVVEGQVDAVVIPVKGHRFHVDVGIDQLCTADLDVSGAVQLGLGAIG